MFSHVKQLGCLTFLHILLIGLSNVLVLYPIMIFGFQTTYGAFSYPFIFILTDLTTRFLGPQQAKRIVLLALLPGLLCSYFLANYLRQGVFWLEDPLALRVALASLLAYFMGQFLDIFVFQRLKQQARWWVAPSVSNIFGNVSDTFCFFFIAFYQSIDPFLSDHWFEIAAIDLVFKMLISLLTVVPIYGMILQYLSRKKAKLTTLTA